MNTNRITALGIILFAALTSCKDLESTIEKPSSLENVSSVVDEYSQFRDTYSDAALLLVRHSDFNSANALAEHLSVGFINESLIIPNSISINDQVLNSQNEYTVHNEYDDGLTNTIYGHNLMIKFDNEVLTDSFYNSTAINVSCNINENYFLENGMTFNWNEDLNSKGVIFHVQAYVGGNSETTQIQEKELMLADNGSFTIPEGFLDEFTNGTMMQVTFKRGNYTMLNTSDNLKVSVIGMSSCGGTFIKN